MNKPSKDFLKRLLTQIATAALTEDGVLVGAKVALYTARTGVDDEPEFTDFTPPAFTGYAVSAAVTLGTVFYAEDGGVTIGADLKQFTCSGGTPDDNVIGAVIFTGATSSEKVLWYDDFDSPVPITEVGNALRYAANFTLGDPSTYGKGSLVS